MYGMSTPLFKSLRTDKNKSDEGVWFTNTESGDKLRIRPLMNEDQVREYLEAVEVYVDKHGEDKRDSDEADRFATAQSVATGQITDWVLSDDPDMKYDPALMAAALVDPELDDLRIWVRTCGLKKSEFRPEASTGK